MTIPDHEHHVRVTLMHTELNTAYGLRPGFGLTLRVPYDFKDQHVRYATFDGAPFVPPYGDIHHRTEAVRGIADGDLLLLWEPASQWRFGIGTTLPLGRTVPDPIDLGRRGLKHEHLQFGSGVFAPEFEIGWRRWAQLHATIPLTTNSRGFRAPKNFQWTLGPSYKWFAVKAAGQYQTLGRWRGEIDEGTGFSNGGLGSSRRFPLETSH